MREMLPTDIGLDWGAFMARGVIALSYDVVREE